MGDGVDESSGADLRAQINRLLQQEHDIAERISARLGRPGARMLDGPDTVQQRLHWVLARLEGERAKALARLRLLER